MTFKKFVLASFFVAGIAPPSFAQAITFRVIGAAGAVLLEQSLSSSGSVGVVSDSLLSQAVKSRRIKQYEGSTAGVASIAGLGSANEVLSDSQMNAYGWCYSVDGKMPDVGADQYNLTGSEEQIVWFYAYAHLEGTKWTSMCVPADHVPVQE